MLTSSKLITKTVASFHKYSANWAYQSCVSLWPLFTLNLFGYCKGLNAQLVINFNHFPLKVKDRSTNLICKMCLTLAITLALTLCNSTVFEHVLVWCSFLCCSDIIVIIIGLFKIIISHAFELFNTKIIRVILYFFL